MLFDDGQHIVGIETGEIVNENTVAHQPLSVQFAPDRFAPAGVRNRQVNAVSVDIMPPFGSDKVSDCVCVVVHDKFRITRRARRKEHKSGVVFISCVNAFSTLELVRKRLKFRVEIVPAVTACPDKYFRFDVALFKCFFRLVDDTPRGTDDDRAHACKIEPVYKVLFHKLIRCGNDDRADFVQRND